MGPGPDGHTGSARGQQDARVVGEHDDTILERQPFDVGFVCADREGWLALERETPSKTDSTKRCATPGPAKVSSKAAHSKRMRLCAASVVTWPPKARSMRSLSCHTTCASKERKSQTPPATSSNRMTGTTPKEGPNAFANDAHHFLQTPAPGSEAATSMTTKSTMPAGAGVVSSTFVCDAHAADGIGQGQV